MPGKRENRRPNPRPAPTLVTLELSKCAFDGIVVTSKALHTCSSMFDCRTDFKAVAILPLEA